MSSTHRIVNHRDYSCKDIAATLAACHRDYRSVPRDCGCSRRARVYGDGNAHIPIVGAVIQLCTPTRTTFIHKSGESRRALLSPRSAFYERSVRCLSPDDAYKEHTHAVVSLHGGKKLCANGRDRYQRS